MIFWKLFSTFFTIGLFTFGGGYAMLPLIEERVLENEWLSIEEITNFVAISESTPGPFAVNISTYVGTETAGILGALCATAGVVLPSFLVIIFVAKIYSRFKTSGLVNGMMYGLRAAIVGLLASVLWNMLPTVLFRNARPSFEGIWKPEVICSLVIFVGAAIAGLKKVNPMTIMGVCAIVGIVCGYMIL